MFVIKTTQYGTYYGPFVGAGVAAKWADKNLTCTWCIIPLTTP